MLKYISESIDVAIIAFAIFGLINGYFPLGKTDITKSAIALIVLGAASFIGKVIDGKKK